MNIEVNVSKNELDALEDLATVWILCKKHNAHSPGKTGIELFKMQDSCRACRKEVKLESNQALHLWSKLVHAYEISKHGKCDCQVKKPKKDIAALLGRLGSTKNKLGPWNEKEDR